jgi:hypothetical protein
MVYTFDPAWRDTSDGLPWTLDAKMAVERWYATATELADGRILASAGEARSWLAAFGGKHADGTNDRVLRPLTVAGRYLWADTLAVPMDDDPLPTDPPRSPRVLFDSQTNGNFPPPRTDHVFAGTRTGEGVLYGGRHDLPGGGFEILSDAWLLQPSPLPNDSVEVWQLMEQVAANPADGLPPARTRAAMVWAGLTHSDKHSILPGAVEERTCFLQGGLAADGSHVLGDLWKGHVVDISFPKRRQWVWERLWPDDAAYRRYGHTMWFDPGRAGVDGAPYARLVIFGGQATLSTLADNRLYTFGVGSNSGVQGVWSAITPAADAHGWGSPQARQGHMAAQNWLPNSPNDPPHFFLFGGQDAQGNLLEDEYGAQDTHVWVLERSDQTATSPVYQWQWLASSANGGPTGRARAAMDFESWSRRLVVVGGDTNGDGQSGGLTSEIWSIQVEGYGPGDNLKWSQPLMKVDPLDPQMPATAGHTLIAYGSTAHTHESSLEAYSPTGSLASCGTHTNLQGSWTTISNPNPESERDISAYPYMILLPDGRLFDAGPSPRDNYVAASYRRFYDFATNHWVDDPSVYTQDVFVPGSAVMYRPGKVLRAGTHGALDGGKDQLSPQVTATGRTETIDILTPTAMPAWVQRVPNEFTTFGLTPRQNHNLTVLPTGDVLATGGVSGDLNDLTKAPVRRPQLWRVSAGSWNNDDKNAIVVDTLAGDPNIRNYHSTALLLPDGRVLTAGGEAPNSVQRYTVSLYEPPYLFDGNTYAHRPTISGAPVHLRYGEPFTMTLAADADVDSIRGVALLRPSAVTHGFDQNQRFVPLNFIPRSNPKRLLAWVPVNGNLAPPGVYMLFVTLGRGTTLMPVPSLARWVIVEPPVDTQLDSLDTTPPRGDTYLALNKLDECPQSGSLYLAWTAPADDDTFAFSGRPIGYDLRYIVHSTNPPPPPFGTSWTAIPTGAPGALGAIESAFINGLTPNTWYRFALKAKDNNGLYSALSNVGIYKALVCDGGSGGGGFEDGGGSARRVGGMSAGRGGAGGGLGSENTLLAGVPLGTRASDVLRLSDQPGLFGSTRRAFVRQGERRGLLLDRAKLLAVDHGADIEVVALPGGALLAGTRAAATQVHDRSGSDVTAAATGAGAEPVYADSGEVLEVELPARVGAGARTVLFDLLGGGTDGGGVTLEAQQPDGAWQAIAILHPRREWDTQAVSLAQGSRLRLTFHDAYALRFAGELAGAVQASAQTASLVGAQSSYSGDAFDASRAAVDTSLAMVAGDTLTLAFGDLAPPAEGSARTWLLAVEGTPVTPRLAQSLAHRRDPAPQLSVPLQFALYPAAPNPTRGTVRLAFDLPNRSSVRLEIFDPQGRRVRRFDAEYAPGRQAFEWDLRHTDGPRVAPGIYSYRVIAGSFRAQGRLVVLP